MEREKAGKEKKGKICLFAVFFFSFFFLFSLLSPSLPVTAHIYLTSYSYLTIDRDTVSYQLKIPTIQFLQAIQVEANKLGENLNRAANYLQEHIRILDQGSPCDLELQQVHPLDKDPVFMFIDMIFTCKKPLNNFTMFCKILEDVPELYHQNLAKITFKGETRRFLFTSDNSYDWEIGGIFIEAPQEKSIISIHTKTWLGIQQGISERDLSLFLLVLLLPVATLTEIFKVVVVFTLAQGLTFLLGVFLPFNLAPRFISSTMALSVIYIALENLSAKTIQNRWIPAGTFGLVCGLYFLEVGGSGLENRSSSLTSNLFAFLVGLEVGQLIILLFLVPILYYLNQWKQGYKAIHTLSLVALGIGLFKFLREVF